MVDFVFLKAECETVDTKDTKSMKDMKDMKEEYAGEEDPLRITSKSEKSKRNVLKVLF